MDRFEMYYTPVTETGCWLWTGGKNKNGYGNFRDRGRTRSAHKVSYERHVGCVPQGLFLLHSCHTRSCVNPSHLRLGTAKENAEDRKKDGTYLVGNSHPRSKLTLDQVEKVRKAEGKLKDIAVAFGISLQHVSSIKRGYRRNNMEKI